ncbi:MAG: hypothetical protein WCF33_07635 [Pseudonocardiaceae bacterium]
MKSDVVLYAGREVDLAAFLQSLEGRLCLGTPLTIVTGGNDLGEILKEQEQRLCPAHLTVVFAGMTYPMMHDALLTAEQAVRLATPGKSPPTAAKVRGVLLNLNVLYQVQGASGTFSFSSSPAGAGDPHGKPVPVLQYPVPPGVASRQVGPLYITP